MEINNDVYFVTINLLKCFKKANTKDLVSRCNPSFQYHFELILCYPDETTLSRLEEDAHCVIQKDI